jgi:hypothetical protein
VCRIWAFLLTLPYFTPLKKDVLLVDCVDDEGVATPVNFEVDALKAKGEEGCRNFAMWGKYSANRHDRKYGMWVPPCIDSSSGLHLTVVLEPQQESPAREGQQVEFDGDSEEAIGGEGTTSPYKFLTMTVQKDMFYSKPSQMKEFNVSFSALGGDVRAVPVNGSILEWALDYSATTTALSVKICTLGSRHATVLPTRPLDKDDVGAWVTDVSLI